MKPTGTRKFEALTRIAEKLKEKGHELGWKSSIIGTIDGLVVSVEIDEQRSQVGFRYVSTGKLYMSIRGLESGVRTFPEPKAGFDIDKAVSRIEDMLRKEKRVCDNISADTRAKESRIAEIARAFGAEYNGGPLEINGVVVTLDSLIEKDGTICFRFKRDEDAIKMAFAYSTMAKPKVSK